jgi:hypothetical protein
MIRLVFSAFFGVAVGFGLSCNAQNAYNVPKNAVPRADGQIDQDANKQKETIEQTPLAPKKIQTYEEYVTDQWSAFDNMTKDQN